MQPRKCWLTILLLSAVVIPIVGQSLVINELMQSNVDVVWDGETQEFPDSWVELYNNSPVPVSLSGYKIGTRIDGYCHPVRAWQLPANVVVPAYGYQLVYCDNEGEKLQVKMQKMNAEMKVTDDDIERAKLHTNFRLESGKGCVVYLFKDDVLDLSASVVDSLNQQPAPMSLMVVCRTEVITGVMS